MSELFERLSDAIEARLQPERRVDLPELCERLELPDAPDDPRLSKRQYILSRVAKLSGADAQTRRVAASFAERYPVASGNESAYEIEELLWADSGYPTLSKRLRREIAGVLEDQVLWLHAGGFLDALGRLWVLQDAMDAMSELFGGRSESLRTQIEQHVVRNPDDWPREYFFEELGALDCSDVRFCRFIEALAGPEVRPDEPSQRSFVEAVNGVLYRHSLEIAETGEADGYPTFSLRAVGTGAAGQPKNLIFASSVKPDLRFRDAVNNDVEIVTHADKVLVYDRPIPAEGLRWRDLQAWWAELKGHEDGKTAKETLYKRLFASLPSESPPQQLLFRAFFKFFRDAVPRLPALLPEVWLHYDPKTVTQRGRLALLRQRMDFLLLISPGTRVVIEVDGAQHYSDDAGKASPSVYAKMVAADRELRLCGYDVYRFSGHELHGKSGEQLVGRFFDELFKRHRVSG